MSDVISVGNRVSNLDVSPQFLPFSKVRLYISDERAYEAGNDSGRTLELDNPFGTQEMANSILAKLSGFQYQPYTADGALLDPAAEMGDFISARGVFGGIFERKLTFGRLMMANVGSPTDEEINHEYAYETPSERKFKRETAELRASILVNAGAIEAEVSRASSAEGELSSRLTLTATEISAEVASKVSENGGSNTSGSFSWTLTASGHNWYANGNSKPVMSVTASGLTVNGTVNATGGTIGGFTIGANALTYNGLEWNGNNKNTGVYIGQNGIQLGKNFKVTNQGAVTASNLAINGGSISIGNNFNVDSNGNVTANNMTLTGTLTVGGNQITAANLYTGASQAYSNYGNWNTSYASTSPGGYCYGGAGGGYSFNRAQNSSTPVGSFFGNTIGAFSGLNVYQNGSLNCYGRFFKSNTELTLKTKTIGGETINYLGY